jgi:peptidoglycan/LPS O-acetylase OafA/YrhL
VQLNRTPAVPVEQQSHRFLEFDSLRGLAAGTVVIWHFLQFYEDKRFFHIARILPTAPFYNGPAAVILFFVLSGFVLTLPFLRRPQPYAAYLSRRFCRIYLPYAAALLIAVLCNLWLGPLHPGNILADVLWRNPPTRHEVLLQLSGIGNFDAERFNGVFWTLVLEMRMSIVFPVIVWLTKRLRPAYVLLLCIALLPAAAKISIPGVLTVVSFLIGSSLAVNFKTAAAWWNSLNRTRKLQLLAAALVLYGYFTNIAALIRYSWFAIIINALASLSVVVFLLASSQETRLRHWLHHPALQRLGAMSYSLYLVHFTVLISLTKLLWAQVNGVVLFLCYILTSWLVCEAFHAIVEKPTMQLGRVIGKYLDSKSLRPTPQSALT